MATAPKTRGVHETATAILIDFVWNGKRHRERFRDLQPNAKTLRSAALARKQIVEEIRLGAFDLEAFAEHFPSSPFLKRSGSSVPERAKQLAETFKDVAAIWVEGVTNKLQRTTLREYVNALNHNFLSPPKGVTPIGDRPIADITFEELQLVLGQLAPKTAKHFNNIMTPLRQVFRYAVDTDRISVSPADKIAAQRLKKPVPHPLDLDEVKRLLDYLQTNADPIWWHYFQVAIFTGLRPSEMIALRWSSVYLKPGEERIHVCSARVRAIDKNTKTGEVRDVDLGAQALDAIRRQLRLKLSQLGVEVSSASNTEEGNAQLQNLRMTVSIEDDFVFHQPNGARLFDTDPAVVAWTAALKALKIMPRHARQTRHTFATMGLSAGVNPDYMAMQLGHSDTRMFHQVYSKWINSKRNIVERDKLSSFAATAID